MQLLPFPGARDEAYPTSTMFQRQDRESGREDLSDTLPDGLVSPVPNALPGCPLRVPAVVAAEPLSSLRAWPVEARQNRVSPHPDGERSSASSDPESRRSQCIEDTDHVRCDLCRSAPWETLHWNRVLQSACLSQSLSGLTIPTYGFCPLVPRDRSSIEHQ
jgi:hypothetical protein